jgi:3-hydroxyacyl-[acyl-carrier-protein] dehydratase
MRWFWIDRFLEFESGRRAKAVKNVSLAEEHLHDHFPGYPVHPNALIIEGLAQTGGLVVCEHFRFEEKVVLAKVPQATFHFPARPGDTLTYTADIEYITQDGALARCTSHVGERLQAEMGIVFAILSGDFAGKTLIDPLSLQHMMRILQAYEVGRDAQGEPLALPAGLAG